MSYESQVFYWPFFYRSESKGVTVFTYLIWKMWGLINACKEPVDHPPETLHLCCVILIHCIRFFLNLCWPSNDLWKLRKYYWKWLRVLFNMDYIFFKVGDVRTYVAYGPNKLALWCFHNKYRKLSSPAWIAGRCFEVRVQTSGGTKLCECGLRVYKVNSECCEWGTKPLFSVPCALRLSVFPKM